MLQESKVGKVVMETEKELIHLYADEEGSLNEEEDTTDDENDSEDDDDDDSNEEESTDLEN